MLLGIRYLLCPKGFLYPRLLSWYNIKQFNHYFIHSTNIMPSFRVRLGAAHVSSFYTCEDCLLHHFPDSLLPLPFSDSALRETSPGEHFHPCQRGLARSPLTVRPLLSAWPAAVCPFGCGLAAEGTAQRLRPWWSSKATLEPCHNSFWCSPMPAPLLPAAPLLVKI